MRGAARGAGRQGVLAGPCSLPPSGGPARAPARCAAVRRGRGLCGASAAAAASRSVPRGAGPPAPLPRRCAVRACSPSGCCASLRPRAPSFCAGAPRFAPPLPGLGPPRWALRSLRGVLAPLRPRRAAAFGGVARRPGGGGAVPPPGPLFPRLSALGACAASFPLRVARRLSPLRGFGLGRPRRARAPLRRGPAAGRPRGARRGPLRRAPSWGARAPPAWGLGFAPLRRRFFRGCCGALLSRAARRGLASPALLVRLAFGCGFLRTLTAALLPRGLFAPSAHLLFSEKVSCKASRKAQHIVSAIHLIYHIQANSAKLEFCRIICGFRQ